MKRMQSVRRLWDLHGGGHASCVCVRKNHTSPRDARLYLHSYDFYVLGSSYALLAAVRPAPPAGTSTARSTCATPAAQSTRQSRMSCTSS